MQERHWCSDATLWGKFLSVLTGRTVIRVAGGTIKTGKKTIRARLFFILPHPSTNLSIKQYYTNEPRFDGEYSRNNGWGIYNKFWLIWWY